MFFWFPRDKRWVIMRVHHVGMKHEFYNEPFVSLIGYGGLTDAIICTSEMNVKPAHVRTKLISDICLI